MFKKILVPLDGSEIAGKVLPQVANLAKVLKARVTLFHVCYSGVGAFAGEATPETIRAEETHEEKFCSTFLSKAGQNLQAEGLEVNWACQDGEPSREIIAYAQDNDYDLIALGTHGAGEVAWYMGSIADRVASHATVPVLLFRTFRTQPPVLKEIYSAVPGVDLP